MSATSAIEWTESTWNPIRGCTKVSPGCANCYAETFAERFRGVPGHPYEQGFDLRLVPEKLTEPLRWKKPRRIFVNSMSDLFQDGVPDNYIDQVFAVMALCPQHTFQVLTKRAERMREYMHGLGRSFARLQAACPEGWTLTWSEIPLVGWPLPNVWLGTSVENQHFADERIPLLLQTPAAVRFISAEPLLGPVNLHRYVTHIPAGGTSPEWDRNQLDWVIVGGESGPGARPCNIDHVHAVVDQCRAAGVPVFVKQLGAKPWADNNPSTKRVRLPYGTPEEQAAAVTALGEYFDNVVRYTFRDRKGGDPSEWPRALRIREYPNDRHTSPTSPAALDPVDGIDTS